MSTASFTLFALSVILPNLILAFRAFNLPVSSAVLGHLPNFSFALVLASFVTGVAYLFDSTRNWSLGILLYLGFEAAILVSTVLLFQMKEAQRQKLLKDAMAGATPAPVGDAAAPPIEIAETKAKGCSPVVIADTATPDATDGWTVSSLLSWHVYLYRLQVRFAVQGGGVEVTAEAETYDANWFELYMAGIGLMIPGAQLFTLFAAGSIAASYYRAVQTARGNAICLQGDNGACVIIANADPAIAPDRHNEVSAAALIVATRVSQKIMQFQLSGVATMSGHTTIQDMKLGGTAGASGVAPGPFSSPTTGATLPLNVNAGVNIGITIVPSPTAKRNLARGRSILIECRETEMA